MIVLVISRPERSQGLLYKQLCDELSESWFVKISLRRHHALMVEDGAFSHKIDYSKFFRRFEISKGIQITLMVQKL